MAITHRTRLLFFARAAGFGKLGNVVGFEFFINTFPACRIAVEQPALFWKRPVDRVVGRKSGYLFFRGVSRVPYAARRGRDGRANHNRLTGVM